MSSSYCVKSTGQGRQQAECRHGKVLIGSRKTHGTHSTLSMKDPFEVTKEGRKENGLYDLLTSNFLFFSFTFLHLLFHILFFSFFFFTCGQGWENVPSFSRLRCRHSCQTTSKPWASQTPNQTGSFCPGGLCCSSW